MLEYTNYCKVYIIYIRVYFLYSNMLFLTHRGVYALLKHISVSFLLIILIVGLLSITGITPQIVKGSEPIIVDGKGYDWNYDMCHALDPYGDLLDSTSDWYNSRDLLAWYYAVGDNYVYMRLDFLDLAYGAETASYQNIRDALNIYLMIGWENAPGYQEWVPDYVQYNGKGIHLSDYHWVLALAIYDTYHYKVYDYSWNTIYENSGLQIAFNSQWDLVEIAIPTSLLEQYGWTPTSRVWAKIATTLVIGDSNVLADIMPNNIYDNGDRYEWSGALFSDSHVGTAKLMIIHHGNQHLTDNRALNNPSSDHSYGYILWVHENVSEEAGRPIPVTIHMSGTLLASFMWWDPGFISYIKDLINKGIVSIVGGVWAEYITAYFYDNFNAPSAQYAKEYYEKIFGYTPKTAWIPERTWDDDRTGIAWTISKYYEAVILDGNTHHDDWMPNTNYMKPHKYDTSRTDGRTLYVFFIDWNTQQLLLDNTDGGLHIDLRKEYISKALDSDQQQVIVYADDWEKAAGIAGWTTDPHNYENSIRWIAMHPWIQVVTPDEVVDWLDNGYWSPVTGYYCGYDTYAYIKSWVQDYPYDYRRAYDGWYWGTSSEESFAWLGSGDPGYQLPDTIMPFGDVFGYTSFNGSVNNTVIYKLLAPNNEFDHAPNNEFWWLALVTANAMLYETAWHEEDDWDGDGLQDCPGWARQVWNHLRLVNVLLIAAYWLKAARNGEITKASYMIGDFDWDGKDEVIVYNPYIMAFIDQRGGAVAYVFVYDPATDLAYMAVGAPMAYWTTEEDLWYGASQVGLFVDDYYSGTGYNYYDKDYNLTAWYDSSYGEVIVKFIPPDLNGDGKQDFYKYLVLPDNEPYFYMYYWLPSGGDLYDAMGLSVDPMTNLVYGDVLSPINTPDGTQIFGYYNTVSGAETYIEPLQYVSYTGSQDLVKYTMQYIFKLDIQSGSDWSIVAAVFTTG